MHSALQTNTERQTRSAQIRSSLSHPVVDTDGHAVEFGPVYLDFLKKVGGPSIRDRYVKMLNANEWQRLSKAERLRKRVPRTASWTHPAKNTLDLATAMIPSLFRERLDDFGIDYSIVYSSLGLGTISYSDEELRRATCRALNEMMADIYSAHGDRMTPVATIPSHKPEEAIDELDHCVTKLGMKAAMISTHVARPIPEVAEKAPELARYAVWLDTLCMESPYDYDPLWKKCVDLKVAVTSHSPSIGWGSRVVTNHYIHNHVGSFSASGEAFAKAVVLGGVTKRFPTLNFAFLEGGVAWASELYAGLVGHCSKRNPTVIGNYDPNAVDTQLLADLFEKYGQGLVNGRPDPKDPDLSRWPGGWHWDEDETIAHELDALGITRGEDLRPLFEPNFYFGCEADDHFVKLSFDTSMNPFGSKLKAMFSSDVGHWDVPDMTETVEEAYELIEHGPIDEGQFKEFMFSNAVKLHGGMNPAFFQGTVVEAEAKKILRGE